MMVKLLTVATFVSFGFCSNENEGNIPADVTVDEQNNGAYMIQSNIEPDNNFDIEKEDKEMQNAIYQSLSSASNLESSFSNLERNSSRSENTSDAIDRNMEYEVGQEVECKYMGGEYFPCQLISFENDKWTVAWDNDTTTDMEHVVAHLRPQSLTSDFKKGDQVLWRDEQCTIVNIDLTEPLRDCIVKVNGTEREVSTELLRLTKVVTASTEDLAIHQVEDLPQKANVSNNDQATTSTLNTNVVQTESPQSMESTSSKREQLLVEDVGSFQEEIESRCDGCGCCSIENTPQAATYALQEEGTNCNDRCIENTQQVVTYTTSNTAKETTSRISKTTVFCIVIGVVFLCVIISLIIAIVLHKYKQAANHSQASKKPLPNKGLSKTEEKELSSIHLQDTEFDRTALNGLSTISLEEPELNSEFPSTIEVSEKDIVTENVSATATDGDTQVPMAPEHIV